MILVDWTRMGRTYCLAGVIVQNDEYRVVRPLLASQRNAAVRNTGWSPFLLDGHCRWEVFELVAPEPAPPQPPHLEDIYVRDLRSRGTLADPEERRAILRATVTPDGQPLFGADLTTTRTAAYLNARVGGRSLASVAVPAKTVSFTVAEREGSVEADYRVDLTLPGLGPRTLPLKDHFLLERAELAGPTPLSRKRALELALRQMGEQVVVRLGLTRPFAASAGQAEGVCWLMADGFFSYSDPQP
jgi:hypothetical protein